MNDSYDETNVRSVCDVDIHPCSKVENRRLLTNILWTKRVIEDRTLG